MTGTNARATAALMLAAAAAAFAGPAAASEEPPRHRPASDEPAGLHRVGLDAGWASAVGVLGATYAFRPTPRFIAEAGLGLGITGSQLSVMPKLALGAFRAGAGLAWSHGTDAHDTVHDVIWVNVDALGLDLVARSGLSLGLAAGVTIPLADSHWDVTELGADIRAGTIYPQGRISLGWWF